jgi:pimeloyl-ACP methyl ester carboxylesterase
MSDQATRSKRGYGSIEDGVKIVNYNEDDSSSQPTATFPTRSWLHPGVFCVGLVIIAALVGHHSSTTIDASTSGKPTIFEGQLVDHFDPTNNSTWSQPYFVSDAHFAGPGHPILVILGGEGPVTQILYPFVSEKLAKEFGAYVLQTEHRFYGNSQPVGYNVSNRQLDLYLSPEQALADWIRLIKHVQVKLGCAVHDRMSSNYCPVITIGGSYPGFLSAMMRLNYPNVVDIAYASSAPLKLYEHNRQFDSDGYYDFVTKVRFFDQICVLSKCCLISLGC